MTTPNPKFENANGRAATPDGGQEAISKVPHAMEAEMAVLGSLMLGEPGTLDTVTAEITEDDFYRDVHGWIFNAMCTLHSKHEPLEIITLKAELERLGILEQIGGVRYLMHLGEIEFTTANAAYYARIVRDKAVKRRLMYAARDVYRAASQDVDEADTVRQMAEQRILACAPRQQTGNWHQLSRLMQDELDEIEQRGLVADTQQGVIGIDSGWSAINVMTGGWHDGDLNLVAARPSMGKTAYSVQTGVHSASTGSVTAVFSLEMNRAQLVQRILCSEAKISSENIRTGQLQDWEWQRLSDSASRMWDLPLFIDDTTNLSVADLATRARRLKHLHGINLIVVDYIQLLAPMQLGRGRIAENKNVEVTETVKALKNLARELEVPVVALSQLTRANERREDKRPQLSDLRDSGSLEAEADMVQFLYRPAYYKRKDAEQTQSPNARSASEEVAWNAEWEEAEIIIAKQRNGPTGTVKLKFTPSWVRFDDLAPNERF